MEDTVKLTPLPGNTINVDCLYERVEDEGRNKTSVNVSVKLSNGRTGQGSVVVETQAPESDFYAAMITAMQKALNNMQS